jgi:hypothetical protein
MVTAKMILEVEQKFAKGDEGLERRGNGRQQPRKRIVKYQSS